MNIFYFYSNMKKKMRQVTTAGVLCILFMVLISGGFPCRSFGADSGITVFWIETDTTTKVNYGSEPVKDFYINGGKDDGITKSMVLDVYREKTVPDPNTRKSFEISVLVGQVKVISLFKDIAVTRIISLTSSDNTPVIRYRTVMLGDYVVPAGETFNLHTYKVKKALPIKDKKPRLAAPDVLLPSKILFEFAKSKLKPEAMKALAVIKKMFSQSKNTDILIAGHTCSLGTEEYNLELSRKRAQSVADYLINTIGIPAYHVRTLYYGEKVPIASNDSEESRIRNRRVAIHFQPHEEKLTKKL
jgi:outer membrane protein OmpA-like peptidoglycan-associated protein